MKKTLFLKSHVCAVLKGLCILFVFLGCENNKAVELHVSIEGNDNYDGSLSNPFGTIPKAVEAVRELRKKGNSNRATIYLRGGRHQLNETLVLGIEDGLLLESENTLAEEIGDGNLIAPHLTFVAYEGEEPVISSGIPVTGWKLAKKPPLELSSKATYG